VLQVLHKYMYVYVNIIPSRFSFLLPQYSYTLCVQGCILYRGYTIIGKIFYYSKKNFKNIVHPMYHDS